MSDEIAYLGLLDDEAILLDESALAIAELDHPGVDLAPYRAILDAIATRLARVGGAAVAAGDRAELLAQVIAGEYGFSGDSRTYDDPANADLIRVIDRRRGLPVTLSIVYVACARRIGWPADALNTPGHVLVRIGPDVAPLLIDPFNAGAVATPEHLAALFGRALGPGAALGRDDFRAMTNRGVLVRLLLNQATRAQTAGEADRALTLYARMTAIAPAHGQGWWERARLEIARGDRGAARASLSAMLEVTRDPALRGRIRAALDGLAAGRADG